MVVSYKIKSSIKLVEFFMMKEIEILTKCLMILCITVKSNFMFGQNVNYGFKSYGQSDNKSTFNPVNSDSEEQHDHISVIKEALNESKHGSKNDTVFFDNGMVNYVSVYFNAISDKSLFAKSVLVKKVYQYDMCGNLRNVTEVYHILEKKDLSRSCFLTNDEWYFKDNEIMTSNCKDTWRKPFIK